MEEQVHKPHRKAKEKKKQTGENPKAFAFANPGKLQKQAARSHDIKEKRLHVPQIDRLPEDAPPRLVAIVGPPGVGKTTLLKSLIRRYAKETMSEPQGPITVVTSKKQRLTFIECPNELEAMVDIAKVADIVLLMIDGNYGFEMETMEFLNVLATTGMPGNVFGILTHLDLFRKPQALKDAKKRLKRRLWTELYQGAHLFHLSGVLNGRYPDREIHNLSRFLSVMKNPRPLVWRNTHPYTMIDSFRDITHPTKIEADPKCDRSIVLSGYLRGTNFSATGQRVHIPGVGDFTISNIEALPDPCPTPATEQAIAKATGKTGRRRLDEKEKKLHAPMSDRSGLKIDGDAIWITREKGFTFNKDDEDRELGEGEELIVGLQAERRLLGQTEDGVQLFKDGEKIDQSALEAERDEEAQSGRKSHRKPRFAAQNAEDREEDDDLEDEELASGDDGEGSDVETEFNEGKLGKLFRNGRDDKTDADDLAFADSDSDLGSISDVEELNEEDGDDFDEEEEYDSDEEAAALRWKDNLREVAQGLHGKRPTYRTADLARYIYDDSMTPSDVLKRWKGEVEEEEESIEEDDEDFFQKKKTEVEDFAEDRHIPIFDYDALATKWSQEDIIESIRDRFAAVSLKKRGGEDEDGDDDEFDGFGEDDEDEDEDEDDEGDGVFEDLETGEVHGKPQKPAEADDLEAEREKNARRKEELKLRFEEEDREGFLNDKANARRDAGVTADEFGEDEWYESQKAMIQKQLDINKAEFEQLDERQRVAVEGLKAGKYAKIVIENVPAEFVENFKPSGPIIVGGLTPTEDRFGYVQVRIKRHRWHKKILKTNDPLIVSLGWRRFQTLPIYSISDSRTRSRMLKYTPEHMHCFGTFYGPLIAPNNGFVAFNSFSASNAGFRISATGTVLSVDESTEIVKKLKLTGAPYKIFKNTAFIKNMFNSSLEIAKFEGAAIKTVSGIRGQIKRALSKPEGCFRATFEDKVLMSDIVFLRAWYPIKPHRFYNPATNLIGWQAMRLTGAVRHAEGLPTPKDRNSQYRKIERVERHFNGLKVPKKLAATLPFKSQIVETKKQKKETYMQKRAVVLGGDEKRARAMVHMLATIKNDKEERRRAKKEEGRKEYRKMMAAQEEKRGEREKKSKDQFWQKEGKKRAAWSDQGGGGKKQKR
ncbi:related to GTP-binding protein Bms1p, required for distinct steps of 40S ribosome biogenesis [Cephalotrichum gorgonifer]|uniref:Related to GTP-binding protein Bms1p, required for distinct steps of 40S ribosome biogenesis n=1 Tax=Cephalotrichum gorgonifer TaxID=2041049 RepID=A0AAE8N6P7_9PEZI|nr:related to GTP-binding protein Bms1p, required for distinct steps of 40S ribosome biogenesis [Cephalotrichum gorgonifer]